jgi:capsid assembly protease
MKPEHLRILTQIHDRPWAITSRALQTILGIVERDPSIDVEAVVARLGKPLENTGNNVRMYGPVAVLGVEGPIFRHANLFTEISGATSVELLSRDFHTALDNPMVSQIVLNINSPGGQVDGIAEFADMVRAATATKPVTAYIDGLGASAAYWIASATQRIVANESAFLGSIGVVATITDRRDAQERQGVRHYEIVSSQSPNKRADVRTDEGRAQLQEVVDALAEVFIGRVAQFRSTTPENVVGNYGGGKILVARKAIAAGMADHIGTFESHLAALRSAERSPLRIAALGASGDALVLRDGLICYEPAHQSSITTGNLCANLNPSAILTIPGTTAPDSNQEDPMADKPNPTPAAPAAAATPTDPTAERQRITAVLTCEEALGREGLARTLALETDQDVETARRILKAAPVATVAPAAPANPLAAAMGQLRNPEVGAGADGGDDTPQAEAQRILQFVPKQQRIGKSA